MMNVFDVADLFVELTRRDYADDVGLIAYYGSRAAGSASERSDLDLYYIPDDGNAGGLYRSVVLDGMAFEFWGLGWDFAERIADGRHRWSVAPSIIAGAKLLYVRSEADEARFKGLQVRITALQQPDQHQQMVARALETFEKAPFFLYRVEYAMTHEDVSGVRWAAMQLLDILIDCLGLVNQRFLAKHWAANVGQLELLTLQPARLQERIKCLLTSIDLKVVAHDARLLLDETRALLLSQQAAQHVPFKAQQVFNGYYAGIKEYLNKVISACERGDVIAATAAAVQIQKEVSMMVAQLETGIPYNEFNPLFEYRTAVDRHGFPDLPSDADCGQLAAWAEAYDRCVQVYFTAHGVALYNTQTLDELRSLIGL